MIKTYNQNNYRPSKLNDGWEYRKIGTSIYGFNRTTGAASILTCKSFKDCNAEFIKLCGKQLGRPKDPIHNITCKGDKY